MDNVILINHHVIKAEFSENAEYKTNNKLSVRTHGSGTFQKADISNKHSKVVIDLTFQLGDMNSAAFLIVETISTFLICDTRYNSDLDSEMENELTQYCSNSALCELEKTIKNISIAFGIPPIDVNLTN